LGMSEQEISENELMFAEERGDIESAPAESPSLRGGAGVSQGGVAADLEALGPDAGTAEPGAPGATGPGNAGVAGAMGATPSV